MNVRNSSTIDASSDTVWAILATDYNNIGDWTTTVLHSEQDPDLPVGEGRIIRVPRLGEVREPIRHMDADKRTFTFEVIAAGFPFFVKSLHSTWSVQPLDANRSEVSINSQFEMLPVVGALMWPLLKKNSRKTFTILLEELKLYAETGENDGC
jgi:hypothetical protein